MRVDSPSFNLLNNQQNVAFSKLRKEKPRTTEQKQQRPQNYKPIGLPSVFSIPAAIASTLEINGFKKIFTQEAETTYNNAVKLARRYKSPTVEARHLWLSSLLEMEKYLEEINDGTAKFDDYTRQKFTQMIATSVVNGHTLDLNEDETREKLQGVVKKHIEVVKSDFEKEALSRPAFSSIPVPSKSLLKQLNEVYNLMYQNSNFETFYDSYYYLMAANSRDKKLKEYFEDFMFDTQNAIMVEDKSKESKFHLSFFDEKANTLWESVDMGNDTIVLCDSENKSAAGYLKSSFENLIKKPNAKYRSINKDNVEIINLNNFANLDFLSDLMAEINKKSKKTGKTTVIVGNIMSIMGGNSIGQQDENSFVVDTKKIMALANKDSKGNKNPNIRFIFTMDPSSYYGNLQGGILTDIIKEYAVQTLPAITAEDARKYLTDEKGVSYIKNELGKDIDVKTIKKAIYLTNDDKGNYPDKVLDLLKRVSMYFVDSDSITTEQLDKYIRQIESLSEASDSEEEINITYNTGKTLNDIVGSQMTKEAAKSVVDEIKNCPKTKGYLIYQSNYTSDGGGRRNTAEAIAGELKIPMITIDAKEFLMKDLSALYQNPNFAELKIKTLITKAKAQARTNQYKTAMLYIENFDNFATDPYKGYSVDSYEQKAFSQLLLEMGKARKEDGANLVVMGSVNNRGVIDDNIRKPGKFMDEIVVYPPMDDNEIKDIIKYYVKKMKLNIEGDKQKQNEIIEHTAITADGFSVVDIMYLLETARSVSLERNKKAIDKADMTEAYLRTIYGRTNKYKTSDHSKKIVTSHEAGHALTLQIMYNVAAKQSDMPWKLPDKVDFITLDPRGYYGGAMFHKDGENKENTFEKIMADLVCSYGGHSAEKILYDYSGSYGITSDMEKARYLAEAAVTDMGMGAKTGVRHIKRNYFGELDVSGKQKEIIEEDEEAILSAAEKISNKILEEYKDFIEQFTQKYWQRVGSGECIITSDEFNQDLQDWLSKQTRDKRYNLEALEDKIAKCINDVKHGKDFHLQ